MAHTAHPVYSPLGVPRSGWHVAWGLLLIVVGTLAVLMPEIAALATVLVLGSLIALGGAFEIAHAIQARPVSGFGWMLASAILTLLLGLVILAAPIAGAASLALLVGGFLLAGGVTRAIWAFRIRPLGGWGWILFDGLLSLMLAVLLLVGWPQLSVAFVGFLTGFSLIFTGVWRIVAGRQIRF